jgi:hypothetical protein
MQQKISTLDKVTKLLTFGTKFSWNFNCFRDKLTEFVRILSKNLHFLEFLMIFWTICEFSIFFHSRIVTYSIIFLKLNFYIFLMVNWKCFLDISFFFLYFYFVLILDFIRNEKSFCCIELNIYFMLT